ncbi:MAG: amphi-Trp domain-containing protein [Candidatus Thermoplasmatota archaeon]|nr:amphi-Trp domain-containing protein [Candidatus Thermoplasmatota archaeon]
MPEIPNESEGEKKRIVKEGDLEHEVYLNKEQIADFLESMAEQLREGDTLTIETDEWEIPFTFRDNIELDIDFEGYGERELEVEIEFKGKREDKAPTIS